MIKKYLLCLLAAAAIGTTSATAASREDVYTVAGTKMEQMHSAHDVVKQLPLITYKNETYNVAGRGVPAVYINNRKVTDIKELMQMPANYLQCVKIITEPDAKYGKDIQAVIILEPIDEQAETFKLNNDLHLSMNHLFAPSDLLTMSYKRKAVKVGAQLGVTEMRNKLHNESYENYYSPSYAPESRTHEIYEPYNHAQTLSGKILVDYTINPDHNLSAHYFVDWMRRNETKKWGDVTHTFLPDSHGNFDFNTPNQSDTVNQFGNSPSTRHEFDIDYTGKVSNVTLSAGNNSFKTSFEDHSLKYQVLNAKQGDLISRDNNPKVERWSRTFVMASLPCFKGSLNAGAEYTYHGMNVKKDQELDPTSCIHADITIDNWAAYLQATQRVKAWTFSAGVRYENTYMKYKALSDDYGATYTYPDGFMFDRRFDDFYPNASITYENGKNKFSLVYTRTYATPNMANMRVRVMPSFTINDYLLMIERINTTALTWSYKWIEANVAHHNYLDPICHTTAGDTDYNWDKYNALDFNVNISPTIGIWSPVFTAHLHKQWFNIKLSNGNTSLDTPQWSLRLNNTLTLPGNWSIRLNGDWYSKGCDRNVKYFSPNFQLDAAIHKNLMNNKLQLELTATNLLNTSWDDVTIYTDYRKRVNKGRKNRIDRTLDLSIRYIL